MKRLFLLLTFVVLSFTTFSQWSQQYFVDEFGDKTNESYILYIDKYGTFSNSATASSTLFTKVIIDEGVRFDMYEYGTGNAVGRAIGDATYTLVLKFSNNKTELFNLYASTNSLYIPAFNTENFINYILEEKLPIKCLIKIKGDYSTESYNFKINPVGFMSYFSKTSYYKTYLEWKQFKNLLDLEQKKLEQHNTQNKKLDSIAKLNEIITDSITGISPIFFKMGYNETKDKMRSLGYIQSIHSDPINGTLIYYDDSLYVYDHYSIKTTIKFHGGMSSIEFVFNGNINIPNNTNIDILSEKIKLLYGTPNVIWNGFYWKDKKENYILLIKSEESQNIILLYIKDINVSIYKDRIHKHI